MEQSRAGLKELTEFSYQRYGLEHRRLEVVSVSNHPFHKRPFGHVLSPVSLNPIAVYLSDFFHGEREGPIKRQNAALPPVTTDLAAPRRYV